MEFLLPLSQLRTTRFSFNHSLILSDEIRSRFATVGIFESHLLTGNLVAQLCCCFSFGFCTLRCIFCNLCCPYPSGRRAALRQGLCPTR